MTAIIRYVFNVVQPGSYLEFNDRKVATDTKLLLVGLDHAFFDANAALNLFHNSPPIRPPVVQGDVTTPEINTRALILAAITEGRRPPLPEELMVMHVANSAQRRREATEISGYERLLVHKQQFIHARAFLLALDLFEKLLNVLLLAPLDRPDITKKLASAAHDFRTALPDLREIRNSTLHFEDRLRGLKTGGKPIFKDVVEGKVMMVDILNGDKYGATLADGSFKELAISEQSMEAAQRVYQAVLDAFPWRGVPIHRPV